MTYESPDSLFPNDRLGNGSDIHEYPAGPGHPDGVVPHQLCRDLGPFERPALVARPDADPGGPGRRQGGHRPDTACGDGFPGCGEPLPRGRACPFHRCHRPCDHRIGDRSHIRGHPEIHRPKRPWGEGSECTKPSLPACFPSGLPSPTS